jgi:hypothetical protein
MKAPEHFEAMEGYGCFRLSGHGPLADAARQVIEAIEFSREQRIRRLLIDVQNWTGHKSPGTLERYHVAQAFAEAAREAAGMPAEPTAEGDLLEVSGISPEEGISMSEDPYAAAADSWAAGQPVSLTEDDDESAARRLYDLALEYQERSQHSEARLLDEFEGLSAGLVSVIGDMIIVDDDDERLSLTASGFRAEVIPEDADDEWRTLSGADELVEFYDPTDVFGDLADALAEAFPAVAPELVDATNGTGGADDAAAAEPAGIEGEAGAATIEADAADAEDEPTA